MKIDRSALKHNSKTMIAQSKPSAITVAAIYVLIIMIIQYLIYAVSGYADYLTKFYNVILASTESGVVTPAVLPSYEIPAAPAIILLVALLILTLIISVGFSIYCMNIGGGKKASYGNILDGFAIFFKVIWLTILMTFFLTLWTLLGMIPGILLTFIAGAMTSKALVIVGIIVMYAGIIPLIIAALRYRQSLYIMIDKPETSALNCIRQSKEMMEGRKGELFVLDLSFIGWWLLRLIPFADIWVAPYTTITYVNYYYALRDMPTYQNTIAQTPEIN